MGEPPKTRYICSSCEFMTLLLYSVSVVSSLLGSALFARRRFIRCILSNILWLFWLASYVETASVVSDCRLRWWLFIWRLYELDLFAELRRDSCWPTWLIWPRIRPGSPESKCSEVCKAEMLVGLFLCSVLRLDLERSFVFLSSEDVVLSISKVRILRELAESFSILSKVSDWFLICRAWYRGGLFLLRIGSAVFWSSNSLWTTGWAWASWTPWNFKSGFVVAAKFISFWLFSACRWICLGRGLLTCGTWSLACC